MLQRSGTHRSGGDVAASHQLDRLRLVTGMHRVLPDFIIIGTQKGGTSSLYQYLSQHPDVAPAFKKEVHYFGWEFARRESWYRAHFPLRAYRRARQAVTGTRVITGEATPYYLFHPLVPGRVRALVPGVRLIVLLRNPVDRAVSSYLHQVRQGRERLSLRDAVAREPERLEGEVERIVRDETYNSEPHRHFSYVARGVYADQLARWFDVFPREQFLIVRSEDFFRETARVFAQTLDFLGLRAWQPQTFHRFNVARRHPPEAGQDDETRASLAEYYAAHNFRLAELLGRDFGWDRA